MRFTDVSGGEMCHSPQILTVDSEMIGQVRGSEILYILVQVHAVFKSIVIIVNSLNVPPHFLHSPHCLWISSWHLMPEITGFVPICQFLKDSLTR